MNSEVFFSWNFGLLGGFLGGGEGGDDDETVQPTVLWKNYGGGTGGGGARDPSYTEFIDSDLGKWDES